MAFERLTTEQYEALSPDKQRAYQRAVQQRIAANEAEIAALEASARTRLELIEDDSEFVEGVRLNEWHAVGKLAVGKDNKPVAPTGWPEHTNQKDATRRHTQPFWDALERKGGNATRSSQADNKWIKALHEKLGMA